MDFNNDMHIYDTYVSIHNIYAFPFYLISFNPSSPNQLRRNTAIVYIRLFSGEEFGCSVFLKNVKNYFTDYIILSA